MNRSEADAVLAVWRELLDDPGDRCKYGHAVQQLFEAAQFLDAEARRLQAIGRMHKVHADALGKRNRDLAEMVQRVGAPEHVEADQAATIYRPNWWLS